MRRRREDCADGRPGIRAEGIQWTETRKAFRTREPSRSRRPSVIIVGGGFGGLSAAQALKSGTCYVTLIDRNNYRLFQPLLYQVATGSLSAGEIPAPLRSVLSRQKNARVLLGTVLDIDPLSKHVLLADRASFEYDWLIVATGSHDSMALYRLRANGAMSTSCRKMQCKTYPIWGGDKS